MAVSSNQFLSGGLVLGFLTGIIVWLRRIPSVITELVKRHWIVQVEIRNCDKLFDWTENWFSQKGYCKKSNKLFVKNVFVSANGSTGDYPETSESDDKVVLVFSPGIGTHIIWYSGALFWAQRTREESQTGFMKPREQFYIETFKCFKPHLLKMLDEVVVSRENDKEIGVSIYIPDYNTWERQCVIDKRSMDTVYLPDNTKNEMIKDINFFKENCALYKSRGIPYRRGYLLYGIPGTGKSTLITALASELGSSVYVIPLGSLHGSGVAFNSLLNNVPNGDFIVIEDIDVFGCSRNRDEEHKDEQEDGKINLSELLNALDGIASHHGKVIFMTTNHKNKLDPALLRPGRIDKQIEFTYITKECAEQMIKNFYPTIEPSRLNTFLESMPNNITPADLQVYLISIENEKNISTYNII